VFVKCRFFSCKKEKAMITTPRKPPIPAAIESPFGEDHNDNTPDTIQDAFARLMDRDDDHEDHNRHCHETLPPRAYVRWGRRKKPRGLPQKVCSPTTNSNGPPRSFVHGSVPVDSTAAPEKDEPLRNITKPPTINTAIADNEAAQQAKRDLLAILPAWPRLTLSGFWERGSWWERSLPKLEKPNAEAIFQQERDALLGPLGLKPFAAARGWLRVYAAKQQSINPHFDSYGLKHVIEEDIGYVANGTVIAAALAEGFAIKQCAGAGGMEINCMFNLTLTSACVERLFPEKGKRGG
jgi:hypothetical protein